MFGIFMSAILHGAAAVDKYRRDKYYMSSPMYYQDGQPVYINASGEKFINGERVISKYDYNKNAIIECGERSGKIYFDEYEEKKKYEKSKDQHLIDLAIKFGELAYIKYDEVLKMNVTCEISTGKYIARLEGFEDGTYKKFYLSKNPLHSDSIEEGDNGIEITQEEYDKLNISHGGHYAKDNYRYVYMYGGQKILKEEYYMSNKDWLIRHCEKTGDYERAKRLREEKEMYQ